MPETFDVAVLGGGVAGLAAARELTLAGVRVILLEARARLGGRIRTLHVPELGIPIELGAEFVHGGAELLDQLTNGKLGLALAGNRHFRVSEDGVEPRGDLRTAIEAFVDLARARLDQHPDSDAPVSEIIAELRADPGLIHEATLLENYIQGFHGADPARFGMRALIREETSADSAGLGYRPLGGYDELVRALARCLSPRAISLRSVVRRVRWSNGGVEIDVTSGIEQEARRVLARRAIVTLPLGVLRDPSALEFQPALADKRQAFDGLEVGPVVRLVLHFREPFWERGVPKIPADEGRLLGFLHGGATPFPTFWAEQPLRAPILVAWAGGPRAERLATLDRAALRDAALTSLAEITGESAARLREALVATYHHDWMADPFARGAYTYTRPGGINAAAKLATPLVDALFFAGEATHGRGEVGTVHGAIETAIEAARLVAAL